jgi:phosphoglycerate dehydrogenase-like enzyme
MKVVFLSKLNRAWLEQIDRLRREFRDTLFVTDPADAEHELETADALVAGEVPRDVVRRAGKLRVIFVPYAGVDALPLDDLRARNVRVANVHVNAPYVAERCIAMALAFYGKVMDYHMDLKERHQWHGYWATGKAEDTWTSIQGRTCALIGTGAIGTYLAKYLKVFDCRVIGFKKRPVPETPAYFDEITLDLTEALRKSELIFVSLPLTEETRGLFSKEILARMKGKFLVNAGRGEVVDEEGLYRALKDGILKGAGIDAWYNYPDPQGTTADPSRFPILDLPNVILSPHLAGFTPQAAMKNMDGTVANIRAYLRQGRAEFEVDLDQRY